MFQRDSSADKLRSQLQQKTCQLDNAEILIAKLKEQAASAAKEAAAAQHAVHQKDKQCAELEAQNGRLLREAKQRSEIIDNLQLQLDTRRRSCSGQQDRALSRSASTAGSEGGGGPDAKALAQQLAAAQSELAALKSARAAEGGKLAADCEMWRERSEGLKAELGAAQKALEGSELAESQLRRQIVEMQGTIQRLEGGLRSAQEEAAGLQAQLATMQRERAAELDRHGADLMARMDQQGQSQRELQAKLQHEQEEKVRLQSSHESMQHTILQLEAKLKEQAVEIVQLQAAVDAREQALEGLQAECKHAADAKSALEQQLASAQLRLDKAEAARKQQLAQLEALQEQLDAAQAAGSEHDGAARAAGERAAAAVDAAEMLRAQLATARDQLSAKEQLLAEAAERLDEKNEELSEMRKEVEHCRVGSGNLRPLLDAAREEAEVHKAELEAKEREIAQLERELEGARKALEEMSPDAAAHQRRLQEAQDAVEAVKARSNAELEELRELLMSKGAQFDSMAAQVQHLTQELKTTAHANQLAGQQVLQLECQLGVVQSGWDEAKLQLEVVLARAERLQGSLEEREEELRVSREKMEQMEVLLEQMHVLNKQMEEGQDALRLANMQFASLADELSVKEEELSVKEMSLDSAQDVLQAKDRKLAHLATQLATQGAMLASADQQIKGWNEKGLQLQGTITALEAQVADMRRLVRDKDDAIRQAQRELEQSQLECLAHKRELNAATASLGDAQRRMDRLMDQLCEAQAVTKADSELGERMMSVERALVREREAHLATKQQLAVGGAEDGDDAHSPGAAGNSRRSSLSAREAASMRNHIINLERQLCDMQVQEVERQVADLEAQGSTHSTPVQSPPRPNRGEADLSGDSSPGEPEPAAAGEEGTAGEQGAVAAEEETAGAAAGEAAADTAGEQAADAEWAAGAAAGEAAAEEGGLFGGQDPATEDGLAAQDGDLPLQQEQGEGQKEEQPSMAAAVDSPPEDSAPEVLASPTAEPAAGAAELEVVDMDSSAGSGEAEDGAAGVEAALDSGEAEGVAAVAEASPADAEGVSSPVAAAEASPGTPEAAAGAVSPAAREEGALQSFPLFAGDEDAGSEGGGGDSAPPPDEQLVAAAAGEQVAAPEGQQQPGVEAPAKEGSGGEEEEEGEEAPAAGGAGGSASPGPTPSKSAKKKKRSKKKKGRS